MEDRERELRVEKTRLNVARARGLHLLSLATPTMKRNEKAVQNLPVLAPGTATPLGAPRPTTTPSPMALPPASKLGFLE